MMNRLASSTARKLPRQWNRWSAPNPRLLKHHQKNQFAFSTLSSEDLPPSLTALRTSILKSSLDEVHHLGWTDDALAAGTAAVRGKNPNISMSVVGLMTVDDLIAFCMDQWNIQLKKDLLEQKTNSENNNNDAHSMDPLQKGIQTRLEYLIPYLQSSRWHEGMALGIRGPSNALQTRQQLQDMVDIIVASSPNHATIGTPERMALGAVYVATELHLLTDTSPGYQDTWNFLDSRMGDWRRLTALGSGGGGGSSSVGDALFVASSVASSLVGGLLSLVTNPTKGGIFGLPQEVMSALFQSHPGGWEATDRKPGTHPDDYKSSAKK